MKPFRVMLDGDVAVCSVCSKLLYPGDVAVFHPEYDDSPGIVYYGEWYCLDCMEVEECDALPATIV